MSDYGITEKGFNMKRLDKIMDEVHADLTEGFGFDTRQNQPSFLDVLVTTFCNQIAELWEEAQASYYAKYPATATGINLDNAVQYGGIKRRPNKQTIYPLHCTGSDGTNVPAETMVSTITSPTVNLFSIQEFQISREAFNSVRIKVALAEEGAYTVTINGEQFGYTSTEASAETIISGLSGVIQLTGYEVTYNKDILEITDKTKSRINSLILSDNLTTESVTAIANFATEQYGVITLAYKTATIISTDVAGLTAVTNLLSPTYGRIRETDIELRQSYIAKSALRSNTMIESICSELLNNVADVESASGYENCTDVTDSRGLPPHSIEIIVEGGEENEIAAAILRKKAGGIQTHGSEVIDVPGIYGDTITIRFNRPEYIYVWMKIVLHGDASRIPKDYATLTIKSITEDGSEMRAGTNLLTQLLNEGIYKDVAGVSYVDIYTASSTDPNYTPSSEDYALGNVLATTRQKILVDENRIGVTFNENS